MYTEISLNTLTLHNAASPFTNGIFTTIPSIKGLEKPEIRTSTQNRAGGNGAILSNQLYGGRAFTLEGFIYKPTFSEFFAIRDALINECRIEKDEDGFLILKTLYITRADGKEFQIECVLRDFTIGAEKYGYVPLQLQFFAPEASVDSLAEYTVQLLAQISGGVIIPVIIPAVFDESAGGSTTINNLGSMEAFPIVTFSGQLTAPILTNVTTGKYMALGQNMVTGDIIIVDMKDQTILKNGTNALDSRILGSEWLGLIAGNNLLQLTTSDSADDGQVSITYRDAYVGI